MIANWISPSAFEGDLTGGARSLSPIAHRVNSQTLV